MNPLLALKSFGQSVWLDSIRRGHILSGDLRRLVEKDGISGETSNPAIFEKAIVGGSDYDEAISELIAAGKSALDVYEAVAVADVQMAADVFRAVYDETHGGDGFVSLEVSPRLAYDSAGTIAEAKRLWARVNRPNLMIKIPGTPEGLPAVEAGATLGWRAYVGLDGAVVGLDRFGASAPYQALYRELGLTTEAVVEAVRVVRRAPPARALPEGLR